MNKQNRIVKFRAWDGVQMINPYCELDNNTNFFVGEDMGDVAILAVMQATGLNDAATIDIYESDIVQIGEKVGNNYVIEWAHHGWAIRNISTRHRTTIKPASFDKCIVVGNIYQQPELLLTAKK